MTSRAGTTHYYVPHGTRWPIFGSIGLFTLMLGAALWLNDFKAGPWFALVAQAVPSIAPGTAARYFRKTECFCFTQQAFEPHESRELKVAFMVAPDLPADIDTLTLSYTFFTAPQS